MSNENIKLLNWKYIAENNGITLTNKCKDCQGFQKLTKIFPWVFSDQ